MTYHKNVTRDASVSDDVALRLAGNPMIALAMLSAVRGAAIFGLRTPEPAWDLPCTGVSCTYEVKNPRLNCH